MTPDALETLVREALAHRAAEVPAEAGDRLRQGRYPVRRGRYWLPQGHYPVRGSRYRARPSGRMLVAAGIAVALAAGLATAALTGSGRGVTPLRHVTQGHATVAAAFLARAAAAARAQSSPASRSGQVYFVREVRRGSGGSQCDLYAQPAPFTDGPIFYAWGLGRAARASCAHAPVPSAASLLRLTSLSSRSFKSERARVRFLRSTAFLQSSWHFMPLTEHAYPPISSLPASPSALRAVLDRAASRDNKSGVNVYDQYEPDYVDGDPAATRRDIFVALVDRLMRAPISGRLRAALYEVIAGLPDVRLIPHVADALGRYGTEVTITVPEFWYPAKDRIVRTSNTHQPVRATNGSLVCAVAAEGPQQSGFILDPRTYRYLGDASSITTTTGTGRGCKQKFYRNTSHGVGAVIQAGFATPGRG